ncbi:MAG TPA: hypothetical protein VNC50_21740 [Planctomycetia bacterium]|nr:hypothetical protein [Planctomycetia bacterium]
MKPIDRKARGRKWREGPFGFPLREESARAVETILKDLPKGKEWDYRRVLAPAAAEDLSDEARTEISVVSSGAVDRDGEVVLPAGVDLEQFRLNPVITFSHQYDRLPVGRALWIKRDGDRIKAKSRYALRPANWQGDWLPDAIWHLIKSGDLRGKSIGFLPLEGSPPTSAEIAANPSWSAVTWIHRRVLLLEYAVAPVQANPEALVESIGKGIVATTAARVLGLSASVAGGMERGERADIFRRAFRERWRSIDLPSLAAERLMRRMGRI